MKGIRRFSVLAAAVSLAMLLGGSMGSNVYAETGHDGSQKQLMTKDHAEHGKHGRHCGHHKWDMFKGSTLAQLKKSRSK